MGVGVACYSRFQKPSMSSSFLIDWRLVTLTTRTRAKGTLGNVGHVLSVHYVASGLSPR